MIRKGVVYARVSSVGERQNTQRQVEDLMKLAEQKSVEVIKTFEEKMSGAKGLKERVVLKECLDYCIGEEVDVLLISELSRLGRNVDDVLSNVRLCKEKGLNVYFQKEGLSIFDDNGNAHPFLTIFIAVLGTVAEMERENIKFRLQSGREKAKRDGVKFGRKVGYRKENDQYKDEYKETIRLLKKGYGIRSVAKLTGTSPTTVMKVKNMYLRKEETV